MSASLRRSRSMCSLHLEECSLLPEECFHNSVSESSVEVYSVDSEDNGECERLERKVDRLNDLFLEQCRLLSEIKVDIHHSRSLGSGGGAQPSPNMLVTDLLIKMLTDSKINDLEVGKELAPGGAGADGVNSRAKSLLDAIMAKTSFCLDREIRDALVDFLQSEELKEHMVSATVESVRSVIGGSFSRELSGVYLPLLQLAHHQLVKRVTGVLEEAFAELESHTCSFSSSVYKGTRSLRRALERHHRLLQDAGAGSSSSNLQYTVEEVLQNELKQWRQKALEVLYVDPDDELEEWEPLPLDCQASPVSPPQPADPERSIIDQLMKSAEINKQIQDGDLNGSFEKALSAEDLSLVMAACRAADPARVFAPCRLAQSVLLSLLQQLATDMVHDTQLKCRYLEEALINLDTTSSATRAHLPLVVGEVRKHLMQFLSKYPSHLASRRVTLIVMAADNLLK